MLRQIWAISWINSSTLCPLYGGRKADSQGNNAAAELNKQPASSPHERSDMREKKCPRMSLRSSGLQFLIAFDTVGIRSKQAFYTL
jgi:hypothetical protein